MWQKEMGQVGKDIRWFVEVSKWVCDTHVWCIYKYVYMIDGWEDIVVEIAAEVNSSIHIIPVIDKTELKCCYVEWCDRNTFMSLFT